MSGWQDNWFWELDRQAVEIFNDANIQQPTSNIQHPMEGEHGTPNTEGSAGKISAFAKATTGQAGSTLFRNHADGFDEGLGEGGSADVFGQAPAVLSAVC